ncbi:MAG: hypothetical protein HZB29_11070 [Nitrospinae bacterium]|nr:hypothetical protein [Nitrospinota bacterium]
MEEAEKLSRGAANKMLVPCGVIDEPVFKRILSGMENSSHTPFKLKEIIRELGKSQSADDPR